MAALTALLVVAGALGAVGDAAAAKKKKAATKLYYRVNVQFTGTENGPTGQYIARSTTRWYLRADDPVLVTRTRKGEASFASADMTGYVTKFSGRSSRPAYTYPGGSCAEGRVEYLLRRKELASGYIALASSRDGLILDGQPSMPGGFMPVDISSDPARCVSDDGQVTHPPGNLTFARCCSPLLTGGRVMGLVGALGISHSAISVPLYEVLRFTIPKKDWGKSFGFTRRRDLTNIYDATASFNYTVRFTACDDSDC
jgi:hypothetical protein